MNICYNGMVFNVVDLAKLLRVDPVWFERAILETEPEPNQFEGNYLVGYYVLVGKPTRTVPIVFNGEKFAKINDIAKKYNVNQMQFNRCIKRGYTIERALELTHRDHPNYFDYNGIRYNSLRELCEDYGVSVQTYRTRILKGTTQEEALEPTRPANKKDPLELAEFYFNGHTFEGISDLAGTYNVRVDEIKRGLELGLSIDEIMSKLIKINIKITPSTKKETTDTGFKQPLVVRSEPIKGF